MRCPACGHPNSESRRFCGECGAALAVDCRACGFRNEPGAKFCGGCGKALGASKAVPPTPLAGSAPSSGPGERRQATVLFSDLCGFTALTERLDPEEVERLMRRLKDRAVAVVEQQGGIVSQFVGDEVLALFGVPAAHEDDPLRAVRAAQGLHALARELSPDVEARVGQLLRMHTGIDSGLVVTSAVDARDGTVGVTGDTVNTAARLKALAEDDAVLLSPEMRSRVAPYFETEALAPLELKGKTGPVVPHRVLREKSVATRFEAATARGLTPFAGRESELDTLRGCLRRAMDGDGQIVTVVGEAGVGKSRLMHEFRRTVDRRRVAVVEGRCQSYGAETPYLPLLDALRRGLRLHEVTDPAMLHDTAVANIRAVSPELEAYLPHLLHLLSIPSDVHNLPEGLQGDPLRRELEAALAGTITMAPRHGPMVVIYEDWHWADEASDAALNTVIRLVGDHPLMLIVVYRPEYPRKWADLPNLTSIVLHALDVSHTDGMLRSVWKVPGLPEGLAAVVHSRTGGNALFNEELAHALRDSGGVTVESGHVRLTRPLDALALPETIHAVIRSRVDRLESGDRGVLRLASAIGREFNRALLERIAALDVGMDPQEVAEALERLARQDLVHQVRVIPQAEYVFKHVLTQEVVYETLLLAQRKRLHAAAGMALESLHSDRLEEIVEDLAHHYGRSENLEKAVQYLQLAGDKAAKSHVLAESGRHYLAAIQLLSDRAMTPVQMRSRIDLSRKLAAVWLYRASEEYLPILEESSALALQLQDRARAIAIDFSIARRYYILGDTTNALERLRRWLDSVDDLAEEPVAAPMLVLRGRLHVSRAEYPEAIRELGKALELLDRFDNPRERVLANAYLALTYLRRGEFSVAFQCVQQGDQVARAMKNVTVASVSTLIRGLVHMMLGEWSLAAQRFRTVMDESERVDNSMMAGLGQFYDGYTQAFLGDIEQQLRRMSESIERAVQERQTLDMSQYLSMTAETSARCGEPDAAAQYATQSLAYGRLGQRFGESIAYRSLAMAESQRAEPDWEQAIRWMGMSLELATERQELPDFAIGCYRYAECLHREGDLDAARERLDQAEALFREMGMDWWTEQAEGLRGRLDRGEPFVWFVPYVDGTPKLDA